MYFRLDNLLPHGINCMGLISTLREGESCILGIIVSFIACNIYSNQFIVTANAGAEKREVGSLTSKSAHCHCARIFSAGGACVAR